MTGIPIEKLKLSALEQQLKEIMESRGDMSSRIMTSQELNDYQQWMFEHFSHTPHPSYNAADISRFPNITKKASVLHHTDSLSGSCPIHFQNEVISVKPGTVLVVAPSVIHATPCYEDDQVLLYYIHHSRQHI